MREVVALLLLWLVVMLLIVYALAGQREQPLLIDQTEVAQ